MNVLVLGANSDVAEALCIQLASKGHDLVLAGRSLDKLDPLMSDISIRYASINVSTIFFDAEDLGSCRSFYDSLDPKPDWVICAFGILVDQSQANTDETLKLRSYIVNFLGAVTILDVIANDFEKRQNGVIVGISSVAGDRGRGSNYTYGSAKAGFSAYLSGLRNRLSKSNTHVLTVKPGFISSKMTAHLELPKVLTASPDQVAAGIYKGIIRRRNVIYVKWFWRYLMLIIKMIPEKIFKKMNL